MAQLLSHLYSCYHIPHHHLCSSRHCTLSKLGFRPRSQTSSLDSGIEVQKFAIKRSICTADELHFVTTSKRDWRLALWRYTPPPEAPIRNHPLLLLSGVGTNAVGYDLSPESSFARYMSSQGFDTWILEFRGAGLSCEIEEIKDTTKLGTNDAFKNSIIETRSNEVIFSDKSLSSDCNQLCNTTERGESKLVSKLTETLMWLCERLSGFMNANQLNMICMKLLDQISKILGDSPLYDVFYEFRLKLLNLLESKQNFGLGSQIRDFSQGLVSAIEECQRSLSPQVFDLHDRFTTAIEEFQKQIELIVKYDWDFDHYLEEDVPHAVEYIRTQSKPDDGKLFAIGHSMGGILLYAMLSHLGTDHGLAAIVTLGSALDYSASNSSFKFLLPLADPAQALNVPAVPLGAIMGALYPLSCHPPYLLSSLNSLISAEGMMHPDLLKKLVLNNFGTIPAKLILQLTTAFKEGGLSDRSGTFLYKDNLHNSNIPVLALAGDRDLICPPRAVYDTLKLIPDHLAEYKEFGRPDGPHYGHYDLVGGRLAIKEVCPHIIRFLGRYDGVL